jgi:hypothetical protein
LSATTGDWEQSLRAEKAFGAWRKVGVAKAENDVESAGKDMRRLQLLGGRA